MDFNHNKQDVIFVLEDELRLLTRRENALLAGMTYQSAQRDNARIDRIQLLAKYLMSELKDLRGY